MNRSYAIPLVPAVVGVILALNALLAPFGNTGVDGTLGAALALIGSAFVALAIGVVLMRPLPHGWFVTLTAAAMLAALLTAVAAFFLMQTLLMAAMLITLLA
ncbi:MAG: pyrroloquinoline quinone-dependent dehydrogenase, partial [Paracoccus sp. (in: a-proteobacteria)]